jgi:hypothetical protein
VTPVHWAAEPLSRGAPPPMQTPGPQVPAPQFEHVAPLLPHAVVAPPAWQAPVESQQPAQLAALQPAAASGDVIELSPLVVASPASSPVVASPPSSALASLSSPASSPTPLLVPTGLPLDVPLLLPKPVPLLLPLLVELPVFTGGVPLSPEFGLLELEPQPAAIAPDTVKQASRDREALVIDRFLS